MNCSATECPFRNFKREDAGAYVIFWLSIGYESARQIQAVYHPLYVFLPRDVEAVLAPMIPKSLSILAMDTSIDMGKFRALIINHRQILLLSNNFLILFST